MDRVYIEKLITYSSLLLEEVEAYQKSIDNLIEVLKPMGNNIPDFLVDWLEKTVEEIKAIQIKYEESLK